jgi:signal transduction histidine kinase
MGEDREAETIYEILQSLDAMNASVVCAIRSERGDLYGLLSIRDERLRDAFSPEEIQLLRGLAAQAAIAVENSRLYRSMKERDRLAALGEMSAGLAHEIRNPLGAIKASAQFLVDEDAANPHPEREFLDIIVEEVDRLNRVVSSFLDYARPSKGDPAPTDVNAAVMRTMQLLGAECAAADVTFTTELDAEAPKVRIDVEQLRQVLINLVQNAVQAMETGGAIQIRTRSRERHSISGRTSRYVEIRVTDTGPGIPQRVLKNLFVPFVTTKDRGTGLGLAISQRIVTAAGGRIEARTHAGEGTTFVVTLPLAEETAPASVPAPPPPPISKPAPALVPVSAPDAATRQSAPSSPSGAEGSGATASGSGGGNGSGGNGTSSELEVGGETASGVATSR